MDPEFRRQVVDNDEAALEKAYFAGTSPHLFAVDWRADDAEIVEDCAACLDLDSLNAEWREEDELWITWQGREAKVPLQLDAGDRHVTLCTLNDALAPAYEIRFAVFSHGSDTLGFAALTADDWRELEKANGEAVAASSIDPRRLPNVMTELRDADLPEPARARHQRLVARSRKPSVAAEGKPKGFFQRLFARL